MACLMLKNSIDMFVIKNIYSYNKIKPNTYTDRILSEYRHTVTLPHIYCQTEFSDMTQPYVSEYLLQYYHQIVKKTSSKFRPMMRRH